MPRALRSALFLLAIVPVTAFGFLSSSLGILFDPGRGRVSAFFVRLWGRMVLFVAGARLVVEGADRVAGGEPRVLVANHASYLDIPALFVAFGGSLRFVARRSLGWLPFVGWFLRLGGHFLIDREDPRQALALMGDIADRMRRRRVSVLVFPEGTRSRDGRLQPLKPGSFWLPAVGGFAVQPVAVLGSHRLLPKGAWAPRAGGVVRVRFGDPIRAGGSQASAARKEAADAARAALVALGVPSGLPQEP